MKTELQNYRSSTEAAKAESGGTDILTAKGLQTTKTAIPRRQGPPGNGMSTDLPLANMLPNSSPTPPMRAFFHNLASSNSNQPRRAESN